MASASRQNSVCVERERFLILKPFDSDFDSDSESESVELLDKVEARKGRKDWLCVSLSREPTLERLQELAQERNTEEKTSEELWTSTWTCVKRPKN